MTGAVWRPLLVYVFLLVLFRSTGKRTLRQTTTFDFVLLLIISEAVSSALLAEDHSLTGALIAVCVLVSCDVVLSQARRRWPRFDRLLTYEPTVLVIDGALLTVNLKREGLSRDDVLEAAREAHGIAQMIEIRHAVLEASGKISVIPFRDTELRGELNSSARAPLA